MTTTAPSLFYRQHHQVEAPQIDERAFRAGWRVKTPLDRLFRDRAITWREYQAGCRFRAANERAFGGLLRSSAFGVRRGNAPAPSIGPGLFDSLDDIGELHAVAVALQKLSRKPAADEPPLSYILLDAVIVQEIEWKALAEQYRVDTRTIRRWTVTAIKALAAFTS